jgi:hypothetical protein
MSTHGHHVQRGGSTVKITLTFCVEIGLAPKKQPYQSLIARPGSPRESRYAIWTHGINLDFAGDATQNNMVKQFSKDAEESAVEQQNRMT